MEYQGAELLIKSLQAEGVDTIFGYPGGAIMSVYDVLYKYKKTINHILVRHEQGATHAAQGFARVTGKTGTVIVTSGPAATNIITGVADAMSDSTPMVVITGQIASPLLGTDAFQETDVVGITQPVTKWSYQIRNASEIAWAVARAFYIASTGRPGPVVLDFTKDAQVSFASFNYQKCNFIRSYNPNPEIEEPNIRKAAELINKSRKPLLLVGQGVILSKAESELVSLMEKSDIPAGWTLLGASAIPTKHRLNKGMLGMHGNIAPNRKTDECDLIVAIGMRFDDRVTMGVSTYAHQAKVIHFDIDASEFNKNIKVDVAVLGDARKSLLKLLPLIESKSRREWIESFNKDQLLEESKVITPEINPTEGELLMGEVIRKISEATENKAVLVTDVGQNQMMAARYFQFTQSKSMVTSGGLGTMGFGLPAAIGAKIGAPERTVILFVGDGGLQMTIQELGTILQTKVGIKIVLLNNEYLGMVRQWQQLFYESRYSETLMVNPDFIAIAKAYEIKGRKVCDRSELIQAIAEMLSDDSPFLLEVCVKKMGMVYPMIPAGKSIREMIVSGE